MEKIVKQLRQRLPGVQFTSGNHLHWSPSLQKITFQDKDTQENIWGLLHEAGHASLRHNTYHSDIELLQLEVAAWDMAERLGKDLKILIDQDHIQDCLDTYRDWLHQRSTCPRCSVVTFQENATTYVCYNCNKSWSVTASRFCRPYRRKKVLSKNRPGPKPQTIFKEKL